ncbi:hypothetical protein FOA52_001334 [Chlamydomonas sp. UWO 241]|nr:hypothetical protein FOA52_001334 [Chlamydomonas sp. UWO 241]
MHGVALLLVALLGVGASSRGVDPSLASHYTGASGTFACLDGSSAIAWERVNDNYCDCKDGSDEPGTPACYNGTFYCANKGSEPRTLSSSFVDDGVCDCCDGTDEPSGCANTCLEAGRAAFEALQSRVVTVAEGIIAKEAATKAHAYAWARRDDRLKALDVVIPGKEAEVEALKIKRERAREDHTIKMQLEARQRQREAPIRAAAAEAARVAAEEAAAAAAAAAAEGEVKERESEEERGRRIASQWTADPAAAGDKQEGQQEQQEQQQEEQETLYDEDGEPLSERARARANQTDWEQFAEFVGVLRKYFWSWGDWMKMVAKEGIRNDLTRRRQGDNSQGSYIEELMKTRHRNKEEQRQAAVNRARMEEWDFGPNEEFFPLAGKCISSEEGTWQTELCMFHMAHQLDTSMDIDYPEAHVLLGWWKGFGEGHRTAGFDQGGACTLPNGDESQRSITASLECGPTELLSQLSVPDAFKTDRPCTYTATLATPMVCCTAEHAALAAQLAVATRERAELQARLSVSDSGGTGAAPTVVDAGEAAPEVAVELEAGVESDGTAAESGVKDEL